VKQERTRFGAGRPAEEALHHRQVFSGLHDECHGFAKGQGRWPKKQNEINTQKQKQKLQIINTHTHNSWTKTKHACLSFLYIFFFPLSFFLSLKVPYFSPLEY
jgi:hypothetical protein